MIIFLLSGCSLFSKDADAFENYITKINEWNEEEFKIVENYEIAAQDDSVTEKEYIDILKKTMEEYKTFVNKIKKEKIENEKLAPHHKKYIKAIESYQKSMDLDLKVYETKDPDLAGEVDKHVEKANNLALEFQKGLVKLGEKLGIELTWE
ncbi:hypothetical protein K6959_13595 [Bacillus aquiflavi]|uniref:hypothetical protein n=1 Tax=Bacillus aquiflavi TaxID=2672567 RepID=UPI001CA7F07E|nr:hypothetical protein [Bacillus aquiflavi]UAC47657.1 hypothetical protein K6959_13595 [Bacillus aquiflavi]